MKTTVVNPKNIERKWFLVDAEGKALGRLAVAIADILRGKNKPEYNPAHNNGDYVVVINADKVMLTGKKMDQKMYYRHSKYAGGFKEETAKELMARKPEMVLTKAVSGMLPKNKLRDDFLDNLKVYAGTEHPHEAQQPINLDL